MRNRWYAGGIATVLSGALMFAGYMPAAMADDSTTTGSQSTASTPTPSDSPSPTASPSASAPAQSDKSTDTATPTPTPTPTPSATTQTKSQLKSVQNNAVTPLADTPTTGTIVVHAGNIRSGSGISGVSGLSGATYTATAVSGSPSGGPFTCTTDATGTCSIQVPASPTTYQWDVTAQTTGAAPNHYTSTQLDVGDSTTGTATNYSFRTNSKVAVGATVNVPSSTYGQGSGNYTTDARGNKFSGLLAQSLNNPAGPMQQCGINIALVLDQSGSMSQSGKQASLKTAAGQVITALTGTPSSVAIYSFASTTGSSIGKTSTATAASAAPLQTYVNNLGTPAGSTNWDAGLSQVPSGYDLVILLTDGNPTTAGDGSYDGNNDVFGYVEQGIFSANKVKNQGERLVAIGIGVSGGAENLRALSGPTANSDYYLASNTSFGDTLKTLATGACNNTITVNKKIEDANGTVTQPTAANGWNFSGTTTQGSIGNGGVFPATSTMNGVNGVTQQTISLPQSPAPTIKITENATAQQAAGYTLDTAKSSCTVGGATASGISWSGNTVTFTGAANQPIVCNFVNKIIPTYSVTVVKNWASNAIAGDTASLSLTGTSGATSTAPTNGTSVSNTTFHAGDSVTIGETPGSGNKGVYTAGLSCDNATPNGSGTFTMPAKNVTCTYTNTNATAPVTLIKKWNNALIGDSAKLNIGSDAGTTSTVSNGTGTSFTDNANKDTATAPVGSNVTIKEALSGSGQYNTSYVCVDSNNKQVATGSATSGSVQVPQGGMTCTITNDAKTVKVTLHKTWQNAIAGDKTTLSLGGNGQTGSFTSSAQSGASWTDSQTTTITVPVNTTITIGESTVTNASGGTAGGSYSQMYACGNQTGSTSYKVTADTDCTITNVNKGVTILLQKDWVSSVNGDTADLLINGTAGATSKGLGSPTNQLDLTNVAQQQVHVGDTVSIAETLHGTGQYTSTYTCTTPDGATVASGSASSGSFTVPSGAAGSNVTCVIYNTLKKGTVTVTKQWTNGIGGDKATLSLTPGGSGTSTVGGTAGSVVASQTDTNVVSTTQPVGSTVALNDEVQAAGNTGLYDTTYVCVDNGTKATVNRTAIPVTTAGVTCTVTNTPKTANLTLTKKWVGGVAGDTTALTATPAAGYGSAATGSSTNGGAAGDKDATTTIIAGGVASLSEALGAGNKADYTLTSLVCSVDGGTAVPAATSGSFSGTFAVPNTAHSVVCTATNTVNQRTVTLQKNWQGGIKGDTAKLELNQVTPPTSTNPGTSGVDGSVTATANVNEGSTVTVNEALGNNKGVYTSTVQCTGQDSQPLGAGLTFTVPKGSGAINCVITNTAATHTVTFVKKWVDSISGDSIDLSINGGTPVTATTGGGTTTSAQTASAQNVTVGSTVAVAETTTPNHTNKGSYTTSIVCTDPNGTTSTTPSASFTMPDADVTCTATNTDKTVTVKLHKKWVGAVDGDQTVLSIGVNGPLSTTALEPVTAPDTSAVATVTVPVGSGISLSEQLDPNGTNKATYTASSAVCTGDQPNSDGHIAAVTQTTDCTITNTAKVSTITVHKKWVNSIKGDSALISVTGGLTDGSHNSVATGTDGTDPVSASGTAYAGHSVNLGDAVVAPSGVAYDSQLVCSVDGQTVSSTGNKVTAPKDGSPVDCVYTNTGKFGHLTLIKQVQNKNGGMAKPGDWTLTADGPTPGIQGVTGAAAVSDAVAANGSYTLSESASAPGYSLNSLVCTNGDSDANVAQNGKVTVSTGDDITCTFTNVDSPASLTLKKIVDPGTSGSGVTASDFTLTATPIDGTAGDPISGKGGFGATSINAGTYTLSETTKAGFTVEDAWSCPKVGDGRVSLVNNSDGTATLTVGPGAQASCEITNKAVAPTLTLVKDVDNSAYAGAGRPQDWTLNADNGTSTVTGVGGSDSIVNQSVTVGTYDLSEQATGGAYRTDGYSMTDLVCTAGDSSTNLVQNGSVTLHEGDDVTCVFTNTPTPAKWTINKSSVDVNNHNTSGSAMPGDRIDYTITIKHVSGSWPSAGLALSNIDNLSNLLQNATLTGALSTTLGSASINNITNLLSWSATGTDLTSLPTAITINYSAIVNSGAWNVTLPNFLTPPQTVQCVDVNGDATDDCGSTYDTPDLTLWKTSDPTSGSTVMPGSTVTYTLHAYNFTSADLAAGQTETDDLSGVLVHGATLGTLPAGATFDGAHTLTWTLPAIAAGDTATVSFTVNVGSTPVTGGYDLTNVLVPGTIGTCPSEEELRAADVQPAAVPEDASCTTTHHVPYVDLGIVKTASTAGPVDDDPGTSSEFSYTLKVTNNSTDAITNATVSDTLPDQVSLDTTKGTNGFDLPSGWVPTVTGQKITVAIPSMALGETDSITVYVTVKPVVSTVSVVDPGAQPPTPTLPADTIDNTACVQLTGDMDATNDCSTVKVPQKAVEANLWVQCQGDIPYLGYDIRTTANIDTDPVTLTWTASLPGTGGVPANDLDPVPAQIVKSLHAGDSGKILWPGGSVYQNVGVGFPGWRPIVASDYNADGTLKFPASQTFAGLVYDPTHVATDAWRYQSTVTIKVNPTTTATVTYPPATATCAVARTPEVSIHKTASVTSTSAGSSFSYNLAVHNNGLGAASPMTVTDPIPADLKVTGISTSTTAFPRWENCTVTGKDANGFGGTLRCDLFGPLSLNKSAPGITVDVMVSKGATANAITNTATVHWTNMDAPHNTGSDKSSVTVNLGTLAVTGGTPAFGLIGIGFFVILAGVGAILITRRRRHGEPGEQD